MRTRMAPRCRGLTLVLVTAIGVLMGILAWSMAQLGFHARILAVRNVQGMEARTAADAGVADAVLWMQTRLQNAHASGGSWSTSGFPQTVPLTGPLPGSKARYSYTIDTPGADALSSYPGPQYEIVATGTCGPLSKTVKTVLVVGSYWRGIMLTDVLDAKNNLSLTTTPAGGTMTIESNTTGLDGMDFGKGTANANVNILCGSGGDPSSVISPPSPGSGFTVKTGAAPTNLVFPPVSLPAGMPAPSSSQPPATLSTSGMYAYQSISLDKKTLTISAPSSTGPVVIYCAGTLDLGIKGQIVVNAGSALVLYLGGDMTGKNNCALINNNSSDPRCLEIYGLSTCHNITFQNNLTTGVVGGIYAPSAAVSIKNGGMAMTGGLVAYSLSVKNNADFCFDARLQAVSVTDPAATFTIGRWWE